MSTDDLGTTPSGVVFVATPGRYAVETRTGWGDWETGRRFNDLDRAIEYAKDLVNRHSRFEVRVIDTEARA